MDLITYFLRTTIENSWLGRYPNTYDNKQLLVTVIYNFFLELEQAGVLSAGESFAGVDYDRSSVSPEPGRGDRRADRAAGAGVPDRQLCVPQGAAAA